MELSLLSSLPVDCSTRDVARVLGMAVRSVQLMVDRGELEAAGAVLGAVQHSVRVTMAFTVPANAVSGLMTRLNEAGGGQLEWLDATQAPATA